jgi:hypothetical protein
MAAALCWRLAKGTDYAIVEGLNTILLLLANLRLRFDDIPQLENIVLNLLDIDEAGSRAASSHLFDVSFEFPDVLSHDLRIYDVALRRYFSMRSRGESD